MPPPRPYSSWVLGGLTVALLAVSAGTVGYRALRSLSQPAIAPEPAISVAGSDPALEASAPDNPSPGPPEPMPFVEPMPFADAVAAAPPRAPGAAPPGAASAALQQPAPPVAPRPAPTEAELRAALRATPIVMYGAAWCGVCRDARRFLSETGFAVREIDADTTQGGWDKVEQLSGKRAVPLIVVDGEVLAPGLSPQRVMQATARSMERRLGIKGIRLRADG